MLGVWEKLAQLLVTSLVRALRPWFEGARRKERAWRTSPLEDRGLWKAGLRPTTQVAYERALQRFWDHVRLKKVQLDVTSDVDFAAARYVIDLSRTQAEMTFAALERCYPPLKGELPWTKHAVNWRRSQSVVNHHKPMSWEVAQGLAYGLWLLGLPWTGALLLLQWRLGLRPSEGLRLKGADLKLPAAPHSPMVIALGRRRGTKSGREEAVVVQPEDWRTFLLAGLFARKTPPGQTLTTIKTTAQYNVLLRKAAEKVGLTPQWTGHCARAGWATSKWLSEQNFTKLREAGRWRSDASLRIYLDTVCIMDLEDTSDVRRLLPWLRRLSAQFGPLWSRLPGAIPPTDPGNALA